MISKVILLVLLINADGDIVKQHKEAKGSMGECKEIVDAFAELPAPDNHAMFAYCLESKQKGVEL